MTIQRIIIRKNQNGKNISLETAKAQLRYLGYETPYGVDETINTFRFRQHDPQLFKTNSYSTRPLLIAKQHIGYLVVGHLKLSNNILYNAARINRKRTT